MALYKPLLIIQLVWLWTICVNHCHYYIVSRKMIHNTIWTIIMALYEPLLIIQLVWLWTICVNRCHYYIVSRKMIYDIAHNTISMALNNYYDFVWTVEYHCHYYIVSRKMIYDTLIHNLYICMLYEELLVTQPLTLARKL